MIFFVVVAYLFNNIDEMKLTGPTKPSSEVLVKVLSLMGTPDGDTGMVCNESNTDKSTHSWLGI